MRGRVGLVKQIVVLAALLGLAACARQKPPPLAAAPPCASALSPQARKIYDAVRAGPRQGTVREHVTDQTRDMVMMGDMPRSQARPAAIAAAECLHRTP